MSNFSIVARLYFLILVFTICSPVALSETGILQVIQRSTGGEGEEACVGFASPATCPIKCFRADPVCGVDGVTYWCGCPDAACSGTPVAKLGACGVGSGGSAPIPGQAFLLVHIVWLILLGFSLLFGLF